MTGAGRPVRVLIVDDSRTIRAMIGSILDGDPRFEVVGEAGDPFAARDLIKALSPDVLTLDVEMPRMNGLVFLRNLMRLRPMPVVMVSTRTTEQSEEAITALSLGAVDCIDLSRVHGAMDIRAQLTETLIAAAGASLRRSDAQAVSGAAPSQRYRWNGKYVLVGSSTGGVDALERLFMRYPADCPPTFVAQHMPETFLTSFARRLNEKCAANVSIAQDGQPARPGCIYFAPGGRNHLELAGREQIVCRLRADKNDSLYVPSVNVLFDSAIDHAPQVVAAVLTGMGRDGAEALLRLRRSGARTIAQDAASSVIDGMPRAARDMGAAEIVLPLADIADRVLDLCGTFAGATV